MLTIRRLVRSAAIATLLTNLPILASAQSASARNQTWELRIPSGSLIATGDLRHEIKNAQSSAVQLSWAVRPQLAITGTFSWARSRDLASAGAPKLDVFTSDVGAELRSAERNREGRVSARGFVGAGAGARSYNHRTLDVNATHNLAAYASVGGELGIQRIALRLEARDYATGFRPLMTGGTSSARNDVVVMVAVRFNRHRAPEIR